ncbi:MAG: hypothetical protein IK004_05550 [Bacteroidales bacterium]|nr:hypothetical protein [Bacteroidales bacterium]
MKKKTILTLILVLIALSSFAQDKPGWIYNKPKATNSSYLYVVESAMGDTEIAARNQAFARILQSTAMRLGQPINSDEINKAVQSGKTFEVISTQYNIPINKVCEYTEKSTGGFRVYILCQVAKAGNIIVEFDYDFNGCHDIKQYKNGIALLKSVFVPGLGQMGKRRYAEGAVTLATELALLGGAYLTYNTAQNQIDIMKDANTTYKDYVVAKDKYNSMQKANTFFWGAAAAMYVFNLYRAYSAKPKYKSGYALNPTVMPTNYDLAFGVSLTYNF